MRPPTEAAKIKGGVGFVGRCDATGSARYLNTARFFVDRREPHLRLVIMGAAGGIEFPADRSARGSRLWRVWAHTSCLFRQQAGHFDQVE
jgi:hypothetical protein